MNQSINQDSTFFLLLTVCDWIMTIIFSVEMVLKIIGLGFAGHPDAYVASGWNQVGEILLARAATEYIS